MKIMSWIRSGWRRIFASPQPDDRQDIREILCQYYRDVAQDASQLSEHARQMAYPHFRERLLRVAEEERGLVTWLAERIRAFGGEAPPLTFARTSGKNIWEALRMDEEEEKRDEADLVRRINALQSDYPELAEGLRRLRATKHRHRAEIQDLALKSNPNGLPVVTTDEEAFAAQKAVWLDQQKQIWFDQRRMAWEAEGKLTPWAEWVAQREVEWRVNELPNLELRWRKRLAEYGPLGRSHSEIVRMPQAQP